jgi:hypothetical protein
MTSLRPVFTALGEVVQVQPLGGRSVRECPRAVSRQRVVPAGEAGAPPPGVQAPFAGVPTVDSS